MSEPQRPARRFLPEVQALRALAVLLVVAYHLEPRVVPGGFVGVDVFFVISGFLITGHLLREAGETGRIDLPRFWAGRVRRILPASLATIAAVVALSLALSPSTQWETVGRQALASVFSVQNWVLAADSVDYLAAENPPTALQHFWSLGVEEQFYLVWPLLVVAAAALALRRRAGAGSPGAARRLGDRRRMPSIALAIFGVVVCASLAHSIALTSAGDPAAYFVTPTRVWELGAGGLLAAGILRGSHSTWRAPRWATGGTSRSLLALAGLAAIAASAFLYDAGTPFPGAAAALPVLGTVAVILAGRTAGALSVHRVVDLRPVQWTGNVSYSLYLWHWPAVVFHATVSGGDPGPWESLGLLALSLLLAAASHRWIEVPARTFAPLVRSTRTALVAGAVAVAVVASLSTVPGIRQERLLAAERAAAEQLLAAPPSGLGAGSIPAGAPAYAGGSRAIVPAPAAAPADRPALGECVQDPAAPTTKECEIGNSAGGLTVALVGDSHAGHWYQAMAEAAKERGWTLVTYLKSSCPFSAARRTAEVEGGISCAGANAATLRRIVERGDVDAVVTGNWAGSTFAGDAAGGFAEYWSALEDAGIPVYPIVDNPRPGRDEYPRDCVAANPDSPEDCGRSQSDALEHTDATLEAGRREPRANVLDFTDQFCVDGFCPALIGNVLVYRDHHHLSDTYVRTLVPVFTERLLAAMRADGLKP